MAKFHLKDDGSPGRCFARPGRCPKGAEEEHFETKIEARIAAEKRLQENYSATAMGSLRRISKEPENVVISGVSHEFAEDDEKSFFFCSSCNARFSWADPYNELMGGSHAKCFECGETTKLGPESLLIQKSTAWLLDPKNYSKEENVVYHITTRENWAEEIALSPDLKIHLGNEETTRHRASDIYNGDDYDGPFYLHKIRLIPTATTKISLTEDKENRWDELEEPESLYIYPNQWENPGALSVMANQKDFEILETSKPLSYREAGL